MSNPLGTQSCFSRAFRTGDVGFICPKSGDLYITGRTDDVVKVNGVKISVGNIDQLFAGLPRGGGVFTDLGATVTLALERGEIGTRLVCFYLRNTTNAISDTNTFTNADLAEVVRTHFSTFLRVTFVEVISLFNIC